MSKEHIDIGDVLYYGEEFWRVLDIDDDKALCCLDCSIEYMRGPVVNAPWRLDGEDCDYLHSDFAQYIDNFENLLYQTEEQNEERYNLGGSWVEVKNRKAIILSGSWRMCDFLYKYNCADGQEVDFWCKMAPISSAHVKCYYEQLVKLTDGITKSGEDYCYFYIGDSGKAQLCILNRKDKGKILYYNVIDKKAFHNILPVIVLNIENKKAD